MPTASKSSFSLTALLLAAALATAQSPPSLERIRLGLPTGPDTNILRNGSWTPVTVTLRGSKEGNPQGAFRLRIETTDLEELVYQTTVEVPALAAETLKTVIGYTLPAGEGAKFRVLLESKSGQVLRSLEATTREGSGDTSIGPEDWLLLQLGGRAAGLRTSAEKMDKVEGQAAADVRRQRFFGSVEEVSALPDRWTGYDGVDLVILTTGNREFVLQLSQESEAARRLALLEWVRRGGQLVFSVGRNKQEAAGLLARMPFIDCKITGSETVPSLSTLTTEWCNVREVAATLQQVEVATLVSGPRVDVLLREERRPIILQGSFGLGRVFVVGFDVDAAPFSGWDRRDTFWTRIQDLTTPKAVKRQDNRNFNPGIREASDELRSEIKRNLESFEEVPTVSFGWVMLFIVFYILLVGPLDYFVLKKLFKRLEWTWFTFPITVILVSVLAYWAAYSLKGDDLRINKVDLIDVDLTEPAGPQVYGSSAFTIFSPRVASYDIAVTASPTWSTDRPQGTPGPVVTLLETGERTLRAGSQALYRRPYKYLDEEAGMTSVPIPVWATRSFTANWRAPSSVNQIIDIRDDVGPIRIGRDGSGLVGKITNKLPIPMSGVTLFYKDRWYFLDQLAEGESRRLEPLFAIDAEKQRRELRTWFDDNTLAPGVPLAPSGRPVNSNFLLTNDVWRLMKQSMFFRLVDNATKTNAGLRRRDLSWRFGTLQPTIGQPRHRQEAILVARVPLVHDLAEVVNEHGVTATRLQLGRASMRGSMTQDTYLRVLIPVQAEP
jgi:hypothetical protein